MCFSRLVYILAKLLNQEACSSEERPDPHLLHCINMGWFVLDKYYALTEESPVYAAALLLDPSKRSRYITHNWPASWHTAAIDGARQMWLDEYAKVTPSESSSSDADVPPSSERPRNELDKLFDEIAVVDAISADADNFDAFINAPPIHITGSPLEWWCHPDQVKAYPRLSRMAIDILSIPPESSDPESAFSGGRRTLSWDRERMTCENLERVECVGNWQREGIITPASRGGMGIIVSSTIDYDVEREMEQEFD